MLLDTAVLIFAVHSPERISKRAMTVLSNPDNVRELSAISLTEIAVKVTLGKLTFSAESTRQALSDLHIRILSFTAEHAFELFRLPVHHRDPFDRQIVAQALSENVALVTPDARLGEYRGLNMIW